MQTKVSPIVVTASIAAVLAMSAGPANACMSSLGLAKLRAGGMQTSVAQQREAADFDSDAPPSREFEGSSMPGLWKFQFVNADGSPGDFGFDAFSPGGAEVINSFHAPEIGNVCLGVWKQVGLRRVKINHFAPLFGTDLVTFVGTLNIQEDLTLTPDGKTFEGHVLFTGYDADGNMTFQAPGSVKGTRYTLKSPGH